MASGGYAKRRTEQEPVETQSRIPARRTRQLEAVVIEETAPSTDAIPWHNTITKALQLGHAAEKAAAPFVGRVVDEFRPDPLERHRSWLSPLKICIVIGVIFCLVLISAGIVQRPGAPQLSYFGGQVYSLQVGGDLASSWQSNKPLPPKVPIASNGPYSVLGKPTITADFINRVLASYNSPAAGKGQALYDLGVQYGIDPAFALAFFMHESTFGTQGEARITMSLGNLRCIPSHPCIDQDRGGYAQMSSWEDGFRAWYELIRNLYVAQWGLTTVDQIIPRYAPSADHNDEAVYIASLKHAIDTWHAGILRP